MTVTILFDIKYVLHWFNMLIYFFIFVLATAGWSPTLQQKGYAICLGLVQKLCADICPVIFSSLRKSKGSCFQHGCFVLDIRSISVYSSIYDFKYLTASRRKHMGIKLSVCTTRGLLPCFWLLLMLLMQFLKLHISPQMGMFFEFLEESVSTISSCFKAVENCVSSGSFQKWLVIDIKCVAASYYTYV